MTKILILANLVNTLGAVSLFAANLLRLRPPFGDELGSILFGIVPVAMIAAALLLAFSGRIRRTDVLILTLLSLTSMAVGVLYYYRFFMLHPTNADVTYPLPRE